MKAKIFIKLFAASLVLGIAGGGIGAAFSLLIGFITDLRTANSILLCFLPICGVLIVFLYRKLGIESQGTNTVLLAAANEGNLSPPAFAGDICLCQYFSPFRCVGRT